MKPAIPSLSQSLSQLGPWKLGLTLLLSPTQKKLLKLAKKEAWRAKLMEEFYLTQRLSLMFFSNVVYLFEDSADCKDAISRAAFLGVAGYEFYQKNKHVPEYQHLFSTARIPGKKKDSLHHSRRQTHFVVAILGNFYKIDLIDQINVSRLKNTLQLILKDAEFRGSQNSPGLLTALGRKQWCEIYKNLNQDMLNTINGAILFLSLDTRTTPKNRQERIWNASYENASNRWYDKTHQLIVFADGSAALNRDHTWVDGRSTVKYMSSVFQLANQTPVENTQESYPFSLINFENSGVDLKNHYKKSINYISKKKNNRKLLCLEIEDLGEKYWRDRALSADSVMQIAIQRAAFKTFKRWLSINEAVDMSHLEGGRYDTIWTLTTESKKFIKSSLKPIHNLERLHLELGQALHAHKKQVKSCKSGQSPVFHLTALTTLSFWPLISKIVDCRITTSNPGCSPGVQPGAFTDTARNIIGVCYFFSPNRTTVSIKSDGRYVKHTDPFLKAIEESLRFIQEITFLWTRKNLVEPGGTEPPTPNQGTSCRLAAQ